MASSSEIAVRTSEPTRLHVRSRIREILARREVLLNLVRRELKVKYAASVLGALWSLLNPIVYLAVFAFVARVLGAGIPDYPVYLLSGLLAWNLFAATMSSGARSVIDNANLVKKVSFPHEILPLSAVGVALVDFALQSGVFFLFILVSGYGIHLPELALWPLAFVALLVLTVGLSLWFSALNVRYRDVGHLLNIALLVWFWATPIVYAGHQVEKVAFAYDIGGTGLFTLYLLNPLVGIVTGFQAALYGTDLPAGATEPVLFTRGPCERYAIVLVVVLAASLVLLRLGWGYFFSRSGDFAEEL